VPIGTGFRRWLLPRAAGGNTPPRGRRRPAEVRLLPCQARPPPDRGQQDAAGASHDAGTAGRDAAGSVAGAGAASSSSGRAGPAGAICAGGGACWGGGGVGGGTGTLAGTARDAIAGPGRCTSSKVRWGWGRGSWRLSGVKQVKVACTGCNHALLFLHAVPGVSLTETPVCALQDSVFLYGRCCPYLFFIPSLRP